jgi:putative membrane-bound dehydrogenase-like protein
MKHLFFRTGTLSLFSMLVFCRGLAAEPTVTSNDLPRIPAVEARDALKTFHVKPGFHLELAAHEPNVVSPVALSIDENGKMYVVEMVDYSERRDETPHLGRIRLLEDTKGNGVYDKSTVFAENLAWPTAVFCYRGGIFVGATPDILYLKDTNGDGKADVREVVFTGFAEGVKRVNVQAMLNSFIWGLDNRIHGATSGNGGLIKALKHPGTPPLDLHGRDFVIEPRALTMTSEAGGGQHGLSFDDVGRRFACNNSDHIRLYMYDDRYAARNPFYSMPAPLASIAVDGPAAEVYRVSPEEPWRVIRTKWRVAGLVSGPIEGGGRSAGYFTGATGNTIYRGNAFPPEYRDNAFVGDAGGNLVHRKVLYPDGVSLKAQRGPGEENREFVASTDTWFRPVQFANAPDGTLYIIDMYRETIEHPWSLPENLKKFLDLNSGNDRGRIYRLAPDGFRQPKPPRLGKASTAELVATLENPNGWHRDTAARLIYERQDKAAIRPLLRLVKNSREPLARMHALYCLDGLNALERKDIQLGLSDADPVVRQHAVKLSESFLEAKPDSRLTEKLKSLATDSDINVRYQLTFTLGYLKPSDKARPLAAIARRDMDSSWTQAAILSSLKDGASEVFSYVSAEGPFTESKAGKDFLRQIVAVIGAQNNRAEAGQLLAYIQKLKDQGLGFELVRALGEGLKRSGSSLERVGANVGAVFASAKDVALNAGNGENARVQAIQLLGQAGFDVGGAPALSLLELNQPQALQLAAIDTLGKFNDPRVGPALIERWNGLTPRLRTEAAAVLVARPDRATALLRAMETNSIRASALATTQTKFLRNHPDATVRQLAQKVLGAAPSSTRQQVVDSFMPALNLKSDVTHGRKIYSERCVSCHRSGSEGHALGPDLVTVKNSGKDKLLVAILDPNREVRPEFVAYSVETKNDESLIGLIVNETATSVTVRQAFGKEDVIKRADIKKMQSQGQSLMPEGLEAGLAAQDIADLIAYVEAAEPPANAVPATSK